MDGIHRHRFKEYMLLIYLIRINVYLQCFLYKDKKSSEHMTGTDIHSGIYSYDLCLAELLIE